MMMMISAGASGGGQGGLAPPGEILPPPQLRPSVRLSVCHTPVLCLAERKQDREMYTVR